MTETTGDEAAALRPDRAAGLLHDLRDAVSTVSAAAMLMRASGVEDDQRAYLTAIEAASEKMAALTRLLGEARGPAEATSPPPVPATPVPIPLREVAEQVRATLAVRCEAVGLASRFEMAEDTPTTARLDKVRLLRVLDNLIANAAAATRGGPGGKVVVAIHADGAALVFTVADNGPGLGPDPEHWFARGASGSTGHSGLGLWVARRSAVAMSASLDARNAEDGGAVFTLRLSHALPMSGGAAGPGGTTPVLVVDGNPAGREFMRAILASLGADVALAGTIGEAVTLAGGRPFALALIDVRLPDGDGRDLARRLHELQPELRIFAATGGSAEASAAIADGLFAGLLQKPIDPRALGRLVNDTRAQDAGGPAGPQDVEPSGG